MRMSLFVPSALANRLSDVDLDDLQARGIDSIILDLDNTIAPWRSFAVPEDNLNWIDGAKRRGMRICISSNTRNTRRLNEIAARLEAPAISRALKPRRKGFRAALDMMDAEAARTAVIGDQLFTDVLGGNRSGMYTVLVMPLDAHEFIGTKVSRAFEWLLLKWVRGRGLPGTKAEPSQSEREERA